VQGRSDLIEAVAVIDQMLTGPTWKAGEKRRRAVPVKVRPFCASKQQKNAHFH
jgi:hypothetical protein